MKKTALKLALVSTCLAFTMAACSSNRNSEGNADSDSLMMDTEGIETDTMMMDTSSTGVTPGGGTGTNGMGTGTIDSGSGTGTGTGSGMGTPPNP